MSVIGWPWEWVIWQERDQEGGRLSCQCAPCRGRYPTLATRNARLLVDDLPDEDRDEYSAYATA